MDSKITIRQYESPCGLLMLGSFGDRLCLCDWQKEGHSKLIGHRLKRLLDADFETGSSAVIELAATQLDEYFTGKRTDFHVPLLFVGTEFQKAVWNELLNIPYGNTLSYLELSAIIGRPKSVRAVANANGANSISIFAPCHRIIGRDGSLTGYGGGLNVKQFLLELEGHEMTTVDYLNRH